MNEKKPKEVEFRFERIDGYKLIPVSGVWGGPTYRGEILMELFTECPQDVESAIHEVAQNGKLGSEIDRKPRPELERVIVQRKIQVAAILSPETAESIASWLLDKVKQLKEQK